MIKTLRLAIATALLLAAGNAAALGLGQIEVKSRLNQPLLAEIPIISTVPGELEALQAKLASPETFRRIGLPPPSGVAANLQFSLGNDARGRPVIRVTTSAPLTQAVLNFLIEVDWGQGRLVREYSVLVDVPRTASATVPPAVSAPVVAAPNVVQRPAPISAASIVAPAPASASPAVAALPPLERLPAPAPALAPALEPAPASTAIEPLPPPRIPAAPAPEPAPSSTAIKPSPPPPIPAAPAPAPAPASTAIERMPPPPPPIAAMPSPVESSQVATRTGSPTAAPTQFGPVKRGETLSEIASQLPLPTGYTLDQTMLALLRGNPDAFLGEDVNQLKRGAVLRVPGRSEIGEVSADEAALAVREQMNEWRQARVAVAQPDAAPATVTRSAAATAPPPVVRPAAATKRVPTVPRQRAQARLEIAPPLGSVKAQGTRSGTNAGGEGTMLQQQLRQRDEELAASKAEIGELKDRVAELESLHTQQQQLLAMKDSELAAAQQRLADVRKAEPAAVPPATTAPEPARETQATAQTSQPEAPASTSSALPWIWGSLALLGLALLAWLLLRRASRAPGRPRRTFDSAARAASLVSPTQGTAVASGLAAEGPAAVTLTSEELATVQAMPEAVIELGQHPLTPAPRADTPGWVSERRFGAAPEAPSPVAAPLTPSFAQAEQAATPLPPASGAQRLKLVKAYLDMGEDHSAQQLLRELLEDADLAVRYEAARLLRELG